MSEPMKKASRSRCRNGRPRPHRRCVPSGLELHNQTPPVRRIVAVIVMGVLTAIFGGYATLVAADGPISQPRHSGRGIPMRLAERAILILERYPSEVNR